MAHIIALQIALYHARIRIEAGYDPEALHDLRIAVRRKRLPNRPTGFQQRAIVPEYIYADAITLNSRIAKESTTQNCHTRKLLKKVYSPALPCRAPR